MQDVSRYVYHLFKILSLLLLLPAISFAVGFGNYEYRKNSNLILRAGAVKDGSATDFIAVGRMWVGTQYKGFIGSFMNATGAQNINFLSNTGTFDGRKLIDFAGNGLDNLCNAVTYADNGFIAACRSLKSNGYYDIYLVKFDSSGTLDTGFGTSGIVTTGIGGNSTNGQAFVRDITYNSSNTEIAIVGATGTTMRPFIATFDATDGSQTGSTVKETGIEGTAVSVTNDGTYYYMVSTDKNAERDIYVHRYATDLTGSWGSALDLSASGAGTESIPTKVAIIGSNLIISGSNKDDSGTPPWKCMVVSVVKATGALNTNFGVVSGGTDNEGVTIFQHHATRDCILNSVAAPPSGTNILVGGTAYNGSNYDHLFARMDDTGALDTGFDSDGIKINAAGPGDDVSNFILFLDGSTSNVYAGGRVQDVNAYNGLTLNKVNATSGSLTLETARWSATTTTGAAAARRSHTAVWTGSKMIVWGGVDNVGRIQTGGLYDPVANSWSATTTTGAPSARSDHTAIWTGSKMIVWGGYSTTYENTGAQYDPVGNSWSATTTTGAPAARHSHTTVWTGSKMIVWGGVASGGSVNTGGLYNPSNDSWTSTTTTGAPTARYLHTAVWTGSKMIVWGGNYSNTGGVYNPSNDSWTSTTTTNAPTGRSYHTAVWTGSKMIIWAGYDGSSVISSGGQYDPSGNSWTATSTTGVQERYLHTAVWTGSRMIVYGGGVSGNGDTGEQYDPVGNTWTATSSTSAPNAGYFHSAVWTGYKMIIWGGMTGGNTGAAYYPGPLNSGASPRPKITLYQNTYNPISDQLTNTLTYKIAEAASVSFTSANINYTVVSGNPDCSKAVVSSNTTSLVFTLSSCTGDGVLNVTVAAGVATDAFGNTSLVTSDFNMTVDNTDTDSDTVPDLADNCPSNSNSGQENSDSDTKGNACDNCDNDDNEDQANGDSDTFGNACDNCPSTDNEDQADVDLDDVGTLCDNCPNTANTNQTNSDVDSHGDACDNCPMADNAGQADADSDTVGDACDNCVNTSNSNQANPDNDNYGTACDNCPTTGNNGQEDGDADGIGNDCDNCVGNSNSDQANTDGDNYGNVCDNCTSTINNGQEDGDGDTIGSACDNCPSTSNFGQSDGDSDSVGNDCDNCPSASNNSQTDTDSDTYGDACDNCPSTSNMSQTDSDADTVGNDCDNCPSDSNVSQTDADSDTYGAACDSDDNDAGVH